MPRGNRVSGAHHTEIFSKSNVEIFGKLDLKNICRNPIGFNITVKLPCKLPRSLSIIFSLTDITRRGPGPANDRENVGKIYDYVFEKIDIITFPHVNPMGNSGINYPKVG